MQSFATIGLPLIKRDIASRYRGSVFGLFWSFLNPLFLLVVYTFAFGVVMKARWRVPGHDAHVHSTGEFSVILFAGLVLFQFFSDVVSATPSLVTDNANYVKKVVFPLEVLPVVAVGSALFHALVSAAVLLIFVVIVFGSLSSSALLLPFVFSPLVVLVAGVAWALSALGVYFRDLKQVVGPALTAMLFLSPIFFQRSALPVWLQPYLSINPLAIPVEAFRAVVIFGTQPDWTALGYYSLVAIGVAWLGYEFFQKTKRGFADVL